jgi:hypothetical protein
MVLPKMDASVPKGGCILATQLPQSSLESFATGTVGQIWERGELDLRSERVRKKLGTVVVDLGRS